MPNQEKNHEYKVGDIVSYPIKYLGFVYKKKDGIEVKLSKLQIQKTLISAFVSKKFEVKSDESGIHEITGDIKLVNKQAIIIKITKEKIKALYLSTGNAFIITKDLKN